MIRYILQRSTESSSSGGVWRPGSATATDGAAIFSFPEGRVDDGDGGLGYKKSHRGPPVGACDWCTAIHVGTSFSTAGHAQLPATALGFLPRDYFFCVPSACRHVSRDGAGSMTAFANSWNGTGRGQPARAMRLQDSIASSRRVCVYVPDRATHVC